MAGFWDRVGGGVQNAVARGSVYNPTTGQYAPSGIRTQRMIQGGIARTGPMGALASLIWGKATDRSPEAQRFDRGLQVAPHILPNGWRAGQMPQAGVSVPNVGMQGFVPQGVNVGQANGLSGLVMGNQFNNAVDARTNASIQGRLNSNEALIGQQLSAALNAPQGGWVAGGGGARGAYSTGGYASEAQRQANMAATQQALQESRNQTPNNRQMNNYLA